MKLQRRLAKAGGLVTVRRASELLDCSSVMIYRLHREGKLELVKFRDRTRVTEASLERLLREITESPVSR